ncbi:MAG: metallophosphoesterase [Actinomycetia bacterium]|nr:metallophosphoesterase [Actinomycetes bacterium]
MTWVLTGVADQSGPWAGKEVWHVKVKVPSSARSDLYDLRVTAEGSTTITDSQPHAVQVIDEYKDDYNFIQITDFHVNDPRGPGISFVPGPYPDPGQFKNYLYNLKALENVNRLNPDFVVMTGDLPFGVPEFAATLCPLYWPADKRTDFTGEAPDWDGEYSQAYEQLLRLEVPVLCIPGNHDCYNLQLQSGKTQPHTHKQHQDGAHIWHTMIGPRYYGWDYGDKLHVTSMSGYDKPQRDPWALLGIGQRSSMDVYPYLCPVDPSGEMRENQWGWMKRDLEKAKGKYGLLMMAVHQPFYGKSSGDTWASQKQMDDLNKYTHDYGVGLAISGHVHRDDVFIDTTHPKKVVHLNTTTTSFGTFEYPGMRQVFVRGGAVGRYNYKGDCYSLPTYKDTQIKKHANAVDAYLALMDLDTPSVDAGFSGAESESVDKTFKCTNYFTEGNPPVNLDNTVVDFRMEDIGDIGRYQISGGTLLQHWRPKTSYMTLRVKTDNIPPGGTVKTRVRALFIASVKPGSGKAGVTMDVDILGDGESFTPGAGVATFSGEGIKVNSTTVHDRNHATASITIEPNAAAGARDVNVITGTTEPCSLKRGFTVLTEAPAIKACSPTGVVQGHEVDLHVLGHNTHFEDGVSVTDISGEGVTVEPTRVTDSAHATAKIKVGASAATGERDVNVITGAEVPHPLVGGLVIHEAPAHPPFIHDITPGSAPVGSHLTISGGNFGNVMGSSDVTFNGIPVTEYVSWSDSEILCGVPFGSSTGDVRVRTPWGTSEGKKFTVTNFTFYFAEGTCRPGFDPYICIQNPCDNDADVTITYMKGDGTTQEQALNVPPHSRSTIVVKDILGEGDDSAHDFSAKLECTNGEEIIAERPMYFSYGTSGWTGGSDVVGALAPASTFYFAEGTCRPGFDPYMCIQNPGDSDAAVKITYMKGDGAIQEQDLTVSAHSRSTVTVKDALGVGDDPAHDFSAKVESTNDVKIVAERPMYFDYHGIYTGGHDVVGALAPRNSFYFAEGTCRPGFDPYICIQNPNSNDSYVDITYMKGDGTTVEQSLTVGAHTRSTVTVKDTLGEGDDAAHDFSCPVESTNRQEIIAERPMYFSYGAAGWTGGSDVVGDPAPSTVFYFAEGTCRPGFDSYLCIANPELALADVKITYMKGDGSTEEQKIAVGAHSRSTVAVRDILGVGDDAAHDFSCQVESTNGIRIVVERPMYFNYHGAWTGGHDVIGF